METKLFIEHLKNKTRETLSVTLRQTLCYYLYKENIPCSIIANVVGKTKRNVYMSIYRTKDFIEVGDKMTLHCMDEIKEHSIRIKPITVDGIILSKCIGYKLIIDNIIV